MTKTLRILSLLLPAALVLLLAGSVALAEQRVRLVCDNWPPYQYKTDDGARGLSAEIVKAVYERLGYTEFDIKFLPWKRAVNTVRFAEADALFSINYTDERSLYLLYPEEPLFESAWVVWTRAGSSILSMDDLKGKTIGVVLGYSYTDEFWDFIKTNCTVETAHSDDINFRKLSLGRLDALVAEKGNGIHLSSRLHDDSVIPVPRIQIKMDGLFIVFNRKLHDEAFVQRFSDELKEFKQTEEHRRIREKYLGDGG